MGRAISGFVYPRTAKEWLGFGKPHFVLRNSPNSFISRVVGSARLARSAWSTCHVGWNGSQMGHERTSLGGARQGERHSPAAAPAQAEALRVLWQPPACDLLHQTMHLYAGIGASVHCTMEYFVSAASASSSDTAEVGVLP